MNSSAVSRICFMIFIMILQYAYSLYSNINNNIFYLKNNLVSKSRSKYFSTVVKEYRLYAKRRTNISKENSTINKAIVKSSSTVPLSGNINIALNDPDESLVIFTNELNKIQEQQNIYEKTNSFNDLKNDFQADFNDFQNRDYQSKLNSIAENPIFNFKSETNTVVNQIKSFVTSILIADFFVVMFFLIWFLLAAALQSTYPVVLERFQDIFQPIVVPSLTVLMVGSIASGILENQASNQQEQQRNIK